jgi:hypothetical protein
MGQFENETSGTRSTQYVGRMSDFYDKVEAINEREGATTGSLNVLRKAMWLTDQELTDRESLILSALLKLPDAQLAAIIRLACAH